jgi:hypothetical protein
MNTKLLLQDIADWQLKPEQSEVELPSIQRGFVWKPKQVEDLWDSLLREYPIGSFLFSKTGSRYYLMDGQQRATSIFLGFYNPFSAQNQTKAWTIKGELPVVWVDICPKEKPDINKYLIRITTRSHPWGYQANNNQEKLSISDRRKALKIFREKPENKECGYTSFKNTTTFPYDSCCPLPLSFFIESETIEEVIEKVKNYFPEYICTKHGNFENKKDFLHQLKKEELQGILNAVKNIIKYRTINYDIVVDNVLTEEENAENPTLFVRINSSGTTLSGDDLIYSIYKATFPEAKNLVEQAGVNFIAPTQVVSLASRIAWSDINNNVYTKKMNVRDFQHKIKQTNFKNKLRELIEQNIMQKLFTQAIEIMQCKENSLLDEEVPPIIIKHFIGKSQELFLFFVYWLYKHNKANLDNSRKLRIVAKLFSFSWFEFGNIERLWNDGDINDINFWEKSLNQYMWWDGEDGIHFLLSPRLLRDYYGQKEIEKLFLEADEEEHQHKWGLWEKGFGKEIIQYYNKVKSQEFDLETANQYFWEFIHVLRSNKQLILFAQRNYINSEFGDYNQMEDLEDTNVPWDWDHIYPSEWVYRKVYCNQSIKDWNNTNGNLRAISLEWNRSESNSSSPKERLNDPEIRDYSFIKDDWRYWQMIDDRIWDQKKVLYHFRAITTRMINIYEKFWRDLKINELIK